MPGPYLEYDPVKEKRLQRRLKEQKERGLPLEDIMEGEEEEAEEKKKEERILSDDEIWDLDDEDDT